MAPFRLSRLRLRSRSKSEEQAEEAAPSGTQDETAVVRELDATKAQAGQVSVHPRTPRPSRTDLECGSSQALSESGSGSSSVRMHTPMAKTLSFARRKPSKEEEAELYAADPDQVLSPGSAELLRSALQAEAEAGIVASSLVCPITSELMTDPVFTMDGQTYERSAIEAWLKTHDTAPATGRRLLSKKLIDNVGARGMVRELLTRD